MIGVSLLRFSMDLSKAIDVHSVSTCLLLSKLKAYGKNGASCAFPADLRELKLVSSSLAGKASGEVSRMPASSLGPMLFSIFIDDLFFQVKRTKRNAYTDDHQPCYSHVDPIVLVTCLSHDASAAISGT